MDSRTRTILADAAIGAVAGLVATKVYGLVQEALYRPMPEGIKRQEERVRPGPSSQVAAESIAEAVGYPLHDEQRKLAGSAVHYGLGTTWGPVYGLLRRHAGLRPLSAGFLTGAALSLIVDEGLAPALGYSAPNTDYPMLTHLRGFFNHVAYGAAVGVTAETLYRLTGTSPEQHQPRPGPAEGAPTVRRPSSSMADA
jgi:uncharacterized membrane protein YagU involved in acid resistance